jgi:hypothetical protein
MKAVIMDDHGPLSADEIIKFQEKPNAFLYALEATRICIPFLLCFGVVQVLLLHFAKGVSVAFLAKLTLLVVCMMFPIFFLVVMLIAFCLVFIVTSKSVIVRISPFVGESRQMSIPIEDVESIEVRKYGPRYGSVYLVRYKDLYEALSWRLVDVKRAQASIWFSLPWGWPPLTGFYGFRNYDAFARLIIDLRAVARPLYSENLGEIDG